MLPTTTGTVTTPPVATQTPEPATVSPKLPAASGPSGVAPLPSPVRLRLDDMAFAPATDDADGSLRLVFAVSGATDDSGLPGTVAVRLAVPAVDPGKALRVSVELNHDDATTDPSLAVRVTLVDAPASEATVSEAAAATTAKSNTLDIVTPLDVATTTAPQPSAPVAPPADAPAPVEITLPVTTDAVVPDQDVAVPSGRDMAVTVTVGSDAADSTPAPDPDASTTGAAGAAGIAAATPAG